MPKSKSNPEVKLLIKYRVSGYDHGGYCSGCEIDEEDPPDTWESIQTISYKFTKDLNNTHFVDGFLIEDKLKDEGCTPHRTLNGSGYCKGDFWQYYRAISVQKVTE